MHIIPGPGQIIKAYNNKPVHPSAYDSGVITWGQNTVLMATVAVSKAMQVSLLMSAGGGMLLV